MSAPSTVRSTFGARDVGLFLALALTWGMSFLFIKVAVDVVPPLWIVAFRTLIGGAVLYVILRARGRRLPRQAPAWGHLLVLATIGNTVPWSIVAFAQRDIPSGLSAVINSLVPASTLAVAALIGLERLTARKVGGLVLALVGTGIVVSGEFGTPERITSALMVAGATVLYGMGAVYAKRTVSGRMAPMVIATGQVLVAALLATIAALAVDGPPPTTGLELDVVVSVGVLGAFGTGIAFLLFYLLIEQVGATNASMVTYATPVVGVLAGWLLLDERFGWNVLAGGVVLGAGIWLAQRELRPAPAEELQEIRA